VTIKDVYHERRRGQVQSSEREYAERETQNIIKIAGQDNWKMSIESKMLRI